MPVSSAAAEHVGRREAAFSLTANPFCALSVSPRSKLSEIEDSYEDQVVSDPEKEHELLLTKQKLVTPRSRLAAELGWLPDLSPQRSRTILNHLSNRDVDGVRSLLKGLAGLSKANVAADACARFGDPNFVPLLIEAHREIDLPVTLSLLSANRAASRFPAVDDTLVREGLRNLRKDHAAAALSPILQRDAPGAALSSIIAACPPGHEPLVDEIVRQYDQWSAPHLAQTEKQIEEALSALTSDEASQGDRLCRLLAAWDELSQPVQLASLASGLDEPRSLRIYRRVRDGCIDLVRQNRLGLAKELVAALGRVFEELPTAKAEALNDSEILEDLIQRESAAKLLVPLSDAIDRAKADERQFVSQVERIGFTALGPPIVKEVFSAFIDAVRGLSGTNYEDAPLNAIRSFCVDLNNDGGAPGAAYRLLNDASAAAPPRSPDEAKLVAAELISLKQNRDAGMLRKALDANRLTEAARLMDDLIAGADDQAEKQQLLALKRVVDERLERRTRSVIGWALGIGVLIVMFVWGEMDSSSGTYDYNSLDYGAESTADTAASLDPAYPATPYEASPADAYSTDTVEGQPAEESSGVVPGAFADDPSVDAEVPPPISTTATLTRGQLRYCQFEKRRLELVEPLLTTNAGISSANAAISDYNSRCGRFRYEAADLAQVTSELAQAEASLKTQAEARAQEWN